MDINDTDISRFATIKHDYDTVKEQFSNYKFALIERKSKILFLESVKSSMQMDYQSVFEESKSRLKEVKRIGMAIGEEIREQSVQNHLMKRRLADMVVDHDRLEMLRRRFAESEKEISMEERIAQLEAEYGRVCEHAQKMVVELERMNDQSKALVAESEGSHLARLRERMDELKRKKKRWSMVEYDSMLADCYGWYDMMSGLIETVFCTIDGVSMRRNGFDMCVRLGSIAVTIVVRNGSFTGLHGTEGDWAKDILRHCVNLDSARLFVLMAKRQLEKCTCQPLIC